MYKSQGVSFKSWFNDVVDKLTEHKFSTENLDSDQLFDWYMKDFTTAEVLLKYQFLSIKTAHMELFVKHNHGEFTTTFCTDVQAKEFFHKIPEVRKELQMKDAVYKKRN